MLTSILSAVVALAPVAAAQSQNAETVLGAYIFHRHGDRTAKLTPPENFTDLGYDEVYTSGQYYRTRYIAANATNRINGISADLVIQSQIAASAPANDDVLNESALGFLQGLYPAVGATLGSNTLRNGTTVTAPLNGYQLIPVSAVAMSTNSEDSGWLQGSSGCAAAANSSKEFLTSAEYEQLLASTQSFYQSLLPVINGTFSAEAATFKNAYTIYDLINVAQIHNTTNYNDSQLITTDVFHQIFTLANAHEWGLAYNATNDMRAIAGKVLAGQIVQFLNGTVTRSSAQKIGVQFGAYGTFSSFFGLANLTSVNGDFYGMVDYASSMVFELFTNGSSSKPSSDDMYVRFTFANGTASSNTPAVYPLFGTGQSVLSWNDFASSMQKFAIGSTQQWCTACGNSTGTCATFADDASDNDDEKEHGGNGLSPAVNGVIGAFVTLAVVLAVQGAIMLFGGYRLVNTKRQAHGVVSVEGGKYYDLQTLK